MSRNKSRGKKSAINRTVGWLLQPIVYFLISWFVVPFQVLSDLYKNRDDDRRWGLTVFSALLLICVLGFAVVIARSQFKFIELNFSQSLSDPTHFYALGIILCLPRIWNFLFRPIVSIFVPIPAVVLNGDEFYRSQAWRQLRYEVLRIRGAVCELCGSEQTPLHVDHIKPRSKYPQLALDKSNLQVLCADCNIGKGAKYEDDFRAS